MKCPCCGKTVSKTHFACKSGSKGGSVTGASKARSSEQARAAVAKRWEKVRNEKAQAAD